MRPRSWKLPTQAQAEGCPMVRAAGRRIREAGCASSALHGGSGELLSGKADVRVRHHGWLGPARCRREGFTLWTDSPTNWSGSPGDSGRSPCLSGCARLLFPCAQEETRHASCHLEAHISARVRRFGLVVEVSFSGRRQGNSS